jgi:NAD(P)-dependent dehydrogenase (short-subunit alcohol dehydrogenase family)
MILRDPADAGSDKAKLARLQAGKKFVEEFASTVPLKRMGTPEDVSNLVSFLASRNSDCT